MLDKVKMAALVGTILSVVALFVPDLPIPAEFGPAVVTVVMTIVAWVKRERASNLDNLHTL